MVLEGGKITEAGLAELRSRLGTFIRTSQYGIGHYHQAATRDNIRHFAYGIGDPNPLWVDEEYARKTRHGTIIAPPCFLYSVYWCSGRAGGLPGVHGFHSGNDWEFKRTICLDDKIQVQEQFTDVVEKQSKFAGKIVIMYSVAIYCNQGGEVISRCKGWNVRAERAAARERGKYGGVEPYRYSEAELRRIEEEVLAEEIRGAVPRFWEDVQEGEELRPVVKGPLSQGDIIAFIAGTLGGMAHGVALREFRRHPSWAYRDARTGALEAIARVHDQANAAQGAGLSGAYDFGCQRISWLGHLMTNWMGDDGFLKGLYAELRRFNVIGDTQWCKGKVTKKYIENGEHLVDCEIWAANQRGEVTAPGHATVVLPSRKG